MGNLWGAGRENGEGRKGGGQFTSNLGPGWTRIAPRRKEGFQVSERDSGTREGRQPKGRLTREVINGTRQGVCAMCSMLSTCIYVSCYCVNVANKRIVFRL
jgi:hypothetical protein